MTRATTCFSLALTVIVAAPATARTAEFDIPGGPLGQSVAQLGRQARVNVGLADQILSARRVPALRGRMSVERALDRLLRGTGARAERIDESTYRIVIPMPRRQPLPPFPRRAAPPPPPPPQAAPEEQETIVVVGSRRDVPLADYPGSVTVISGSDPDMAGATRGTDAILRRRAEVTTTHLGPGRNKIFIRGMSESSINGVTQATVGQYLGDFRVNYNAPDPDLRLVDIRRIEILEGPQGTLYGAGTLGGILRILPNAPDVSAVTGSISAGLSTTAHGDAGYDTSATLNLPLGPRVAVRTSLYHVDEGGYIDDVGLGIDDVNRVRTTGGRLAARLVPDDEWTVDAMIAKQRIRGDDAQYSDIFLPPLQKFGALPQIFKIDYELFGLSAHRDGWNRDFTLSVSHADQKSFERFDAVPTVDFPLIAKDLTTRVQMYSAEARLNGENDDGTSWVMGAAAYANASKQDRHNEFFFETVPTNALSNDVLDLAVFGEAQVPITANIDLTLGGRLMHVASRGDGLVSQTEKGKKPALVKAKRSEIRALPTIAISARPADDLLIYARYQESYRPGGLTVGFSGVSEFDGDKVRMIEAGLRKRRWSGTPIDLSLVAGYIDWRDVQGDTLDLSSEATTTNIGDARNLFLDASLAWRPIPGAQLEGGLVLVDSKITTGPARGLPLPGVAKVNARAAVTYAMSPFRGAVATVGLSGRYTGQSYLDSGVTYTDIEELIRRKQGNWLDVALLGRLSVGRLAATIDATNLLDSTASRFALGNPPLLGSREFTTPLRPRTVRFGLELAFGR